MPKRRYSALPEGKSPSWLIIVRRGSWPSELSHNGVAEAKKTSSFYTNRETGRLFLASSLINRNSESYRTVIRRVFLSSFSFTSRRYVLIVLICTILYYYSYVVLRKIYALRFGLAGSRVHQSRMDMRIGIAPRGESGENFLIDGINRPTINKFCHAEYWNELILWVKIELHF